MTTHIHWRKVTGLLLALLLSITLVGCSNKTSKTKYYDKDFITSLEQGLEARWKLTDEAGDQDINQSDYKSFINAELKQISSYSSKKFKSTFLQENAIAYINSLKNQKKALKSYNDSDFSTKWNKAYDARNAILVKIDNKYHLKVDSKYNSYLVELRRSGNAANKNTTRNAAVDSLIKSIKFNDKTDDGSGWIEYSATVENTTGANIKDFSAVVKLKDKSNVTTDTQYVNTENWNKNEKVKFKFSTDKDFASYTVTKDYVDFD
ncbi:FxLYD domain-containing protein [Lactiplantibacillus pentosus]|uniref:FxLYD domain-containing protein n=1 Tax=Lactiplantibacillus pentosus TaxID=1589 RepID=UPI0021820352|nr:FxLYD domain-containing protein [Lactiplantibacillus pentosus]MCS8604687.1 hypothetical protein [Lactiplantibacillus pentosus]